MRSSNINKVSKVSNEDRFELQTIGAWTSRVEIIEWKVRNFVHFSQNVCAFVHQVTSEHRLNDLSCQFKECPVLLKLPYICQAGQNDSLIVSIGLLPIVAANLPMLCKRIKPIIYKRRLVQQSRVYEPSDGPVGPTRCVLECLLHSELFVYQCKLCGKCDAQLIGDAVLVARIHVIWIGTCLPAESATAGCLTP